MIKRTCFLTLLVIVGLRPAGSAEAQERLEVAPGFAAQAYPATNGVVNRARLAERWHHLSIAAAPALNPGLPAFSTEVLLAPLQQDTIVPWPWGWMARGLAGGLVAGPIGTAVAYNMVGRSDPGTALDERIRARRKEAVVVGGMLGTAVLAIVLLRVVDLDGVSQGDGGEPRPEPA